MQTDPGAPTESLPDEENRSGDVLVEKEDASGIAVGDYVVSSCGIGQVASIDDSRCKIKLSVREKGVAVLIDAVWTDKLISGLGVEEGVRYSCNV